MLPCLPKQSLKTEKFKELEIMYQNAKMQSISVFLDVSATFSD